MTPPDAHAPHPNTINGQGVTNLMVQPGYLAWFLKMNYPSYRTLKQ